jgi:hypothetical protein
MRSYLNLTQFIDRGASSVLTRAHPYPFAHMLSRRPSLRSQVGNACPFPALKAGLSPYVRLSSRRSPLTRGVPHRFRKCRLGITVFTRGTQETPGFHVGQSCLLCWACPPRPETGTGSGGATRLACCAIPHMCSDSNLLNVTSACQVWARGTAKKREPPTLGHGLLSLYYVSLRRGPFPADRAC